MTTPIEQLAATMTGHLDALKAECAAYRGWLEERGVEIMPRVNEFKRWTA